jgi:DNA ligase (NAD+)
MPTRSPGWTSASATPSRLQRAGDVIPQVVGGGRRTGPVTERYVFPTYCQCPLKTAWFEKYDRGGAETVARRCTGEFACPFQKIEHLMHFVSRRAFDIEGLGEKQLHWPS